MSPPQLQPLGCNLINVPSDHHGMIPSALKDILSRWDPLEVHKPNSTAPKVLYTIPNGGNPTGASMTTERKQEVYKVSLITPCCQARLFLLCLNKNFFTAGPAVRHAHHRGRPVLLPAVWQGTKDFTWLLFSVISTIKRERWRLIWISVFWPAFWQPWAPSFLSMDVDRRVIRMDSFSKILSSGWEPLFIFNSCVHVWLIAHSYCVCLPSLTLLCIWSPVFAGSAFPSCCIHAFHVSSLLKT